MPAAAAPVRPPSSLVSVLPPLGLAMLLGALAQGVSTASSLEHVPVTRGVLAQVLTTLAALVGAVAFLRLTGWLVWDRLVPRYSGLRIPRLLRQFVAEIGRAHV